MTINRRPPGPVMLDLAGLEASAEEREILAHPLVGGVILFARNFASVAQLRALAAVVHAARPGGIVLAVDQEGGRVQRFRDGFTRLPAMRRLGELWDRDAAAACAAARAVGFVLASELRAQGVDLSFAPVLDLDYGSSSVIGDRAFHAEPDAVEQLAAALLAGLGAAGMGAVGKHFPGHGHVAADSHVAIPCDERTLQDILRRDVEPFRRLVGKLAGIMPAHVTYAQADPLPAGFSPFWLQEVLRGRLEFKGAIFSDDLSMQGASVAGDIVARAQAARAAGCDMVLVCNAPGDAIQLLDHWRPRPDTDAAARVASLLPRTPAPALAQLAQDTQFQAARERVAQLTA
ncbi:MAG: beta-N-acetylhexosaminidase [Rhodocyclaceae bacterium]|nr:beta-N-acetylhexosaminidase [Rhodocyclaceae bacterium]MBX3668384.1 beta-N-acetylhexosaminidase [Rhodocyclaceae bacterium]